MAARGDVVVTADEGGAATVWDAKSLSATCTLPQQDDFCTSVALLPLFIIAGYASGIVRLFSVSEGLLLAEVAGHARCITAVDAHPAADVFSSVSEDGTLNVWSVSGTADSCSKVGLVTTASVTDHSLTGVQFLKSAPHHIITSAYDVHNLRILLSV
ncbi:Wdr54 [Symbiodinium sp. KB8]|nr:Wdr54 [Symbiodinium sp. KB8]